jgi:hypothetical protein
MPLAGLKIRTELSPDMDTELSPDMDTELLRDPIPADEPAGMTDPVPPPVRRSKGYTGAPVPAITRTVEKEVREELDAIIKMAALAWSVPDPVCGGALNEQSQAIAAALTNLLKRNPRLLATLRSAGWLGDWVAFGVAAMPVIKAINRHHFMPAQDKDSPDDPTAPRLAEFPAFLPRSGTGNTTVA